MAKYVESELARFYIELVRRRTRAKVATFVEIAERVASLTSECTTVTATLQEWDEQL